MSTNPKVKELNSAFFIFLNSSCVELKTLHITNAFDFIRLISYHNKSSLVTSFLVHLKTQQASADKCLEILSLRNFSFLQCSFF